MNRKLIVSLLALVAGLLGLIAIFELGSSGTSGHAGGVFLDGFAARANDVNRVEFRFPGEDPGFSLRRDGDAWSVEERDGYPADFQKLAGFVTSLADARIVEQKTSNPDNYNQLGVDDPASGGSGTGVRLSGEGFSYDVVIGNRAQRTYRYARVAGDAASFLIDQDPALDASPDAWLDNDIVDIGSDRVRRVVIRHNDGETITIEKASRDDANYSVVDIPDGRELSYVSVGNGIAGALAGLSFDEVRKASAADASTTTVFETWDGLRIIATLIPEDDETWLAFSAEPGAAEDAEVQAAPAPDVDEINARLTGWQYRIAEHKKNLFARRWNDILKDSAGAD